MLATAGFLSERLEGARGGVGVLTLFPGWAVVGSCFAVAPTPWDTQRKQARVINHPGGNPGANPRSISRRCHLREVAFVWELTKETIDLSLGCLQGGKRCTVLATLWNAGNQMLSLTWRGGRIQPQQVVSPCVCPTVGVYEATRHSKDHGGA